MPDLAQLATGGGSSEAGAQTLPAAGDSSGIDALFKGIMQTPQVAAPQVISGYNPQLGPQPRIPQAHERPMQDTNRMPLSNQATSLKLARQHNAFAGIANAVNTVTNRVEQKKLDDMKTNATNVMRAQQQVAYGQAVMNDPNASAETKANAKAVVDSNTKYINDQLSDDKKRKQFAKMFDISFTDPSQNNTPEVKAGQAALAEQKKNTAAGVTANTPEEKKLQEYINDPVKVMQQVGTTGQQPQVSKRNNYADQFLAKMPQQLEANPMYAQQVKQQEIQQKAMLTNIIPQLLRNQLGITKQQMADDAAYNRALANNANKYDIAVKGFEKAEHIANERNKTALKEVDKRNANALRIASMKTAATLGLWDNPDIQRLQPGAKAELLNKATLAGIKGLDDAVNNSQRQIDTVETTIDRLLRNPDGTDRKGITDEEKDRVTAYRGLIAREKATQDGYRSMRDQLQLKINPAGGQQFDPIAAAQNLNTPGASNYGQYQLSANGLGATGNPSIPNNDSEGDETDAINSGDYGGGGGFSIVFQ